MDIPTRFYRILLQINLFSAGYTAGTGNKNMINGGIAMSDMNKEYRLERMNNYAGTAVNERTYNMTIGLTLLWGVLINIVMATFFYLPDPVAQLHSGNRPVFCRHPRLLFPCTQIR